MTRGEPEALLVTMIDPVIAPEAVGANATVKVVEADAAKVTGREIPLTDTPVPLAEMVES
jgi:hypothetical protein